MESEILQKLTEIHATLWMIMLILLFGMLFWIVKTIAQVRLKLKEAWDIGASDYFNAAKYSDLIEHCNDKLKKEPNYPYAIYWLARCYKEQGNNDEALKLFNKLAELQPSWKSEYADPYIQIIQNNSNT